MVSGDCLDLLADFSDAEVDAIVTDPPYGIDFQGERWDGAAIRKSATEQAGRRLAAADAFQHWCQTWASECLRALKPGGHLVAFGAPRTVHRLAAGLEDAGYELRDMLIWLYGTGMPKSQRLKGGRGTLLKPAYEPIVLARRPPDGPIADNIDRHVTGALNVDACRVNDRYPANVALSHHAGCKPDRCARDCPVTLVDGAADAAGGSRRRRISRLFYCTKANRQERDAGCENLPRQALDLFPNAQGDKGPATAANPHPTVKPLALMRWLIRLACPPGGQVLDPFCGSGSTGAAAVVEHREFCGIEREPAYFEIAQARIAHWEAIASGGDAP